MSVKCVRVLLLKRVWLRIIILVDEKRVLYSIVVLSYAHARVILYMG